MYYQKKKPSGLTVALIKLYIYIFYALPIPKTIWSNLNIKIIYNAPTIITKVEEMENTKCWQGCETSGTFCTLQVRESTATTTVEKVGSSIR